MKIVKEDDPGLEFRNDFGIHDEVYYQGEPFTGKRVSECSECEYLDGNAHGRWLHRYESGATRTESLYDQSYIVESRSWYENGLLKIESGEFGERFLNINQALVREFVSAEGIWRDYFSPEGSLKSVSISDESRDWAIRYFSKREELLYTQMKTRHVDGELVRKIDYNDDLMYKYYFDLMSFENPELKDDQMYQMSENGRIHHIWMWFWEVSRRDGRMFMEIVNRVMKHPDQEIQKTIGGIIAYHKFHSYIAKENAVNAATYEFIREYTEYHDKNDPDREGTKLAL